MADLRAVAVIRFERPGIHVVTDAELEYLKDIYYEAKGWTREGLIPKAKLIELGMDDIAAEIGV